MMGAVVRMPALAAGATEATIQEWLVAVGDSVEVGQTIVEIETDKAVVEYGAEVDGVVAAILVAAGRAAAVGAPIVVLAAAGESAADALTAAGIEAGGAGGEASIAAPDAGAEHPSIAVPAAGPGSAPEPVSAEPGPHDATPKRIFATPLVRRLAAERGLDLATVQGSGPRGRVVRRDLDRLAAEEVGRPAAPAPADERTPAPAPAPAPAVGSASYTDIPHTRMRRAIARRLTESTSSVPHFHLMADCVVDELVELRRRVNESAGVKVSVNDFVLKAMAGALQEVPDANAIWTDDAIRRFTGVDIGVAVSIPGGLVTPVVRGVETMSLGRVSAAVRELAERARAGRLAQDELEGGSFAVSNLGRYGTQQFSAIINPPHAGILAVGAASPRAVVGDDGQLRAASVMTVTLSADHRVMDGALAAQLLAAFVTRVENPLSVLV